MIHDRTTDMENPSQCKAIMPLRQKALNPATYGGPQTALHNRRGLQRLQKLWRFKRYSKKVLPDGSNPFLQIKSVHTKKIDEVYAIRNYLSHYSKASARALMQVYKTEYGMRHFLEPGQFMLAYNAKRLWAYFDAFQGASADMLAWY